MAAMVWTEDLEDQPIALVEERPALWNITLQCYSNRNSKDKLWREIESELNIAGKEVRRKWENLRTAYNRYKKPVLSGSSGAPRTSRQQWIISRMSFTEPHTKRKESQSNLTQKELSDTAVASTVGAPKDLAESSLADDAGSEYSTSTSVEPELGLDIEPSDAESTICERTLSEVLSSLSTDKSQRRSAKHTMKDAVEADDAKLMQSISQTLDKLATKPQRQEETDYISLCCKRIEHRMCILPPQQFIQFEFEIDSLLYRLQNQDTA